MRHITLIVAVVALAFTAPAFSEKGGNGNGNGNGNGGGGNGNVTSPTGSCSYGATKVVGTGLPTDQVINFMVTDSSGTHGWVLGYTPDGTWSVHIDPPDGQTTYEFVSRTYGPSGSKYDVFASCSS